MNYEEALKRWGANKANVEDWQNIDVEFNIYPGYACCGGSDPSCYCSFAESPTMDANVYHRQLIKKNHKKVCVYTTNLEYDMMTFLQELFEISQ